MAYRETLQQQPQINYGQQPYGQPYPQPMHQPLPPYQMEQIYQSNMHPQPQKNDDYHRFVNYLNFQKQVDFVNNLVAGGIVRLPEPPTIVDSNQEESSTFSTIFAVAVGTCVAILGMGILGNI